MGMDIETKMSTAFADTCVLIPCLNEGKTIGGVIREFRNELPGCQVLIIDNGSADNTVEESKINNALVVHELRRGKGYAVITGFDLICEEIILMVDGDGTYSARDARIMVEEVRNGFDMVVAIRKSMSDKSFRRLHKSGNYWFSKLQSKTLHVSVEDAFSGYRSFSKNFINSFVSRASGFEIEAALNVHAGMIGARVKNFTSGYLPRHEESNSKLRTYRDGGRILLSIFSYLIKWKPAAVFGAFGTFLLLFAAGLFSIPLIEYLDTGYILHIPTLVVATSVGIISILFLFYAFIAQKIIDFQIENMRRDYRYLRSKITKFNIS